MMTFRALILVLICSTIAVVIGCSSKPSSPFGLPSNGLKKFAPLSSFSSSDTNPQANLPNPPEVDPRAPDQFRVRFRTTKGDFVAEVNREWSPLGADRFYNMVNVGFFQDTVIFRAKSDFMFQFGIHGDPSVNDVWSEANFRDDPPAGISNLPGTLCFAKTGAPNSRSTQMFVNLSNNMPLDGQGFTPFARVVEGMDVVRKINTEYGENPPGEDIQGRFKREGNKYILKRFPRLDLIRSVELL